MLLSSLVDGLSIQVTLGAPDVEPDPDDEAARAEARRLLAD